MGTQAVRRNIDARAIQRVNIVDLTGAQKLLTPYNTASFAKPDVTAAGSSGAWNVSTIPMFTVTGAVIARVYGVVGATALTSTSNTGTLSVGLTAGTSIVFLPLTTVSGGTQFAIGNVWVGTTPTVKGIQLGATVSLWALVNATNICLYIATNNMTAGDMTMYCDWTPVSAGATVVALTP